ncbi:hypothetical protein [Nocardia neocaledoniensis]|uniref:hypothetical protein n=1 Tax=Nocardia neocaledoniensis TaxID=236511 RepID=UPI002455EFF3|nr:hypothetical protein [Nocardia neocaledoniensis]
MSRGLGQAQRNLLGALYIGASGPWYWLEAPDNPADAWVPVGEIGIFLDHHLVVDGDNSSLDDREFKRSRQAALRRAVAGLVKRGYADSGVRNVPSSFLQVSTRWCETPRDIVVAQITDQGRTYVEEHRVDLVVENPLSDYLRGELRDAGFDDVMHLPYRPPLNRPKRKVQRRARRVEAPAVPVAPDEPTRPMSWRKAGVVELLVQEGFDGDSVRALLRAWHREQQRIARVEFGGTAPALEDYRFDEDELDDLRRQLRP